MNNLKFLVGTPVHEKKEYAIYKFLDSLGTFKLPNHAIYIVDNSDTPEFSRRIQKYCQKIGLENCEVEHMKGMVDLEQEDRLARARDKIRDKILAGDYTHWFSVESDIIVPADGPEKLYPYLKDFKFVNHFYPDRAEPNMELGGVGFTIVDRELIEKFKFSENGGFAQCDPLIPNCYYSNDSWFVVRIRRAGYATVDFHELVHGIEHLAS